MTIKVGVLGAAGRMGSTVCEAVDREDDLEVVARVDVDDPLEALTEAGAEVVVDFTTPKTVKDNALFCLRNSINVVIGTTGLTDDDLDELREAASGSGAKAFVAPNFALGAVLMMLFSEKAAKLYEKAEIIELHHDRKLDAPSGTALRTAKLMGNDPEIHSVRLPGLVAHQEVIFGAPGETLTIRHDSLDRWSFMPGVVLAVRKVATLEEPVTVGLESLLDL